MTTQGKIRRNLLTASGLALALLILLLYWTDSTRGYFAALDETETNKNCFCEVREGEGEKLNALKRKLNTTHIIFTVGRLD